MSKKANLSLNLPIRRSVSAKRRRFSARDEVVDLPNLIEIQTKSYAWFFEKGLEELFQEISPIKDFTGKNLELHFGQYFLDKPKYSELLAKERNATFEAPLYVQVKLVNKPKNKTKTQDVYLGDFPLMTNRGTFVINGVERVVVSQLIKSPGVFFSAIYSRGRNYYGGKVIPNRGAWLEFDTDSNGVIGVKIDRKRRIPVTALLRVFGLSIDEDILEAFRDVDTNPDFKYIQNTLDKDPSKNADEGFKEVYKRIRPGDLATVDNARSLIEAMFFNFDRYDLSEVGRYKFSQRLHIPESADRILRKEDLLQVIREIVRLNNSQEPPDDIDHLANRRVRSVGELIQTKFRVGLARMSRIAKDRMSLADLETVTPAQLIHVRPIVAVMQEFFSSSQLSKFMDQTNPLAELEHKRRLSAMGPGGLSRERAGFEVRDVHPTHYGRLCPITTPEGPNIGLVAHLASYGRINEFGFIETPYRKVIQEKSGKRRVTDEVEYLDAYEEAKYVIAQANTRLDGQGYFADERVPVRVHGEPSIASTAEIDYMDVSPKQIVSITTSLIPFLEHDDANRALMGSNMQRQAVPCIRPQSPIVGTGVEEKSALDSGQVVICEEAGVVSSVGGDKIVVTQNNGTRHEYFLKKFLRSNTSTSINQKPIVSKNQKVHRGQALADGPAIENSELALGQNVLVAFISWSGYNYEDAIIISRRLVQDDRY